MINGRQYGAAENDPNEAAVIPPCGLIQYVPPEDLGPLQGAPIGLTYREAMLLYCLPWSLFFRDGYGFGIYTDEHGAQVGTFGRVFPPNVPYIAATSAPTGDVNGRFTAPGILPKIVHQRDLACWYTLQGDIATSGGSPDPDSGDPWRISFNVFGGIRVDQKFADIPFLDIPDAEAAFWPQMVFQAVPSVIPGGSASTNGARDNADFAEVGAMLLDLSTPKFGPFKLELPLFSPEPHYPLGPGEGASVVTRCTLSFDFISFPMADELNQSISQN